MTIIVCTLLLTGSGCLTTTQDNQPEVKKPTRVIMPKEVNEVQLLETEEKQKNIVPITIKVKNWEFVPSSITVKEGDVIDLTLEGTTHWYSFEIPSLNIDQTVKPGQTEKIQFEVKRSGSYSFVCTKHCSNLQQQMSGVLFVRN